MITKLHCCDSIATGFRPPIAFEVDASRSLCQKRSVVIRKYYIQSLNLRLKENAFNWNRSQKVDYNIKHILKW